MSVRSTTQSRGAVYSRTTHQTVFRPGKPSKKLSFQFGPPQGLKARVRFGPGRSRRRFAHTARPIGGVKIAQPIVSTDLVLEESPITLALAASLVDNAGGLLSGSAAARA